MFKYDVLGNIRFGQELQDILSLQGIENIPKFLNPTINDTESELLFENIRKAQDCFVKHMKNKDSISIVCDSDVDGYTSAALMYQYIKRLDKDIKINYYTHEKKQHGLKDLIEKLCEDDSKLVIVPDAGSENAAEAKRLIDLNKDVIILDHHSIDASDNPAIVVNNQLSPRVTDKAITGVGVVYKFCKLLDKYYHVQYADDYLDLVAVGCIADRASVTNLECRYYVLKGLELIQNNQSHNKLIRTFVDANMYSLNNKVTITGVGFYICPLINSMIRLGSYEDNQYLFEAMCNSDKTLIRKVRGHGDVEMSIQEYSLKACESTLRKQRKITEESAEALSEQIEKYKLNSLPILVVNAGEDVDENSTGLIANKLADKYSKPCLLLRRFGDICSGSGRGYDKCSIVNFNKWCVDTGLFSKVAGHAKAFGITIPVDNTNKLFQLLSNMDSIDETIYHVYGVYNQDNFHAQIIKNIARYDYIWGNDVEEPIFLIQGLTVNKYSIFLLGAKQNRIQLQYRNIKLNKFVRSGSLTEEYRDITDLGDNIEFDIIGRFQMNGKEPVVIIDDWMYRKSNKIGGFGI